MMPAAAALVKVAALAVLVVAASSYSQIHGRIVAIDSRRGTIWIRHDPFPALPMPTTIELKPVRRADLIRLRVGQTIDATVETSARPWPASNIRRAPAQLLPATPRR